MIGRIRERRSFDRLRRDGRRVRSEHLWCTFVPDPAAAPPRVAFAIGRADRPAVARNRLRRRLRAVIAASAEAQRVPPGLLLVGVRPTAFELQFDQLAAEWTALARQLATSCPAGSSPRGGGGPR